MSIVDKINEKTGKSANNIAEAVADMLKKDRKSTVIAENIGEGSNITEAIDNLSGKQSANIAEAIDNYNGVDLKSMTIEEALDNVGGEPIIEGEAYAVLDRTSKSLTFFRDEPGKYTDKQEEGDKVYFAGLENEQYYGNWRLSPYVNDYNTVLVKDVIRPLTMSAWFNKCNAETLDLRKIDLSMATVMSATFHNCKARGIQLDWDTSNVVNMDSMFFGCSNLLHVDLSTFNISKVTTMRSMFQGCTALSSIDISSFDTSSIESMGSMFQNCSNLTTIYVSDKFAVNHLSEGAGSMMFDGCVKLVGGNGTTYNKMYNGLSRANIDAPGNPGYFTEKV